MSEAFRSSLANFPGIQSAGAPAVPAKAPAVPAKAAPVVPTKAAVPAVPGRAPGVPVKTADLSDEEALALVETHLKAQGKDPNYASLRGPVVESGFVNPARYAPSVPARSPEHAVELQGIKKPEPAAPVVDELTALTKEQLVALATIECEGAEPKPSKRMREDTLRNMIRLARINRGGRASPVETPEYTLAVEVANVQHEGPKSVKAEGVEVQSMKEAAEVVANEAERLKQLRVSMARQADADQAINFIGEARRTGVLEMHTIVDAANMKLNAEKGVRDWREIQYTSGADLNNAVYDLFSSGALQGAVVVFDDRTPEGSTLKSTLTSLARAGVFVLVRGDVI